MMKTIFIYDQCGVVPVSFFVIEGDYSHLDKVYINNFNHDPVLTNELCTLIYGEDGIDQCVDFLDKFPTDILTTCQEISVVVVGFIP